MSGLVQQLLDVTLQAWIGWLFFSFFAAFLLGMACETLRVPKRIRPLLVATLVLFACVCLDMPWLMLPLIGLLSALIAKWVSTITFEQGVKIGGRYRDVDYSQVKGNPIERVRGEFAALRKAVTNDGPAEKVEIKATNPVCGVIRVSARW
jgi:hypothetical protein